MFTVMFAIPRTSGWVAQWLEMIDDPEQKIARPRQIYTGQRDVDYMPIERARGPREDHQRRRAAPAAAPAPRRLSALALQADHPARASGHAREFEDLDEALAALRAAAEDDPLAGTAAAAGS